MRGRFRAIQHLFVTLWWNLAPAAGLMDKRNLVKWGLRLTRRWGPHRVVGLPSWPALLTVLKIKLSLLAKVPDLSVTL